jgi:hypothetical protein
MPDGSTASEGRTTAADGAGTQSGTPKSGWIVSPRYDLVFFIGSVAVPLVLWGAFSVGWLTGVAVYAIFQIAFNMPHNFQTWTMSILDADDRAKNGRRYAVAGAVVLVVFGVPMVASPGVVFRALNDALIYWGYYHLVRQHYGIQRLYERRMAMAGAPVPPLESKLYARFLDVVSYAPLLIRFRDPELMTIHVGKTSLWVRHPVLPAPVWQGIAAAYGLTILAAIVHHVVLAARGRRELAPRALLLASVTIAFGIAALGVRDLIVAIAIVTSFHNLQYLGLVWFHNRTRAEIAQREGAREGANRPIDWIRGGHVTRYMLVTFGYGVAVFGPIAVFPTAILARLPLTALVALHYYVDARVWRFGDYPGLARYLRLKA